MIKVFSRVPGYSKSIFVPLSVEMDGFLSWRVGGENQNGLSHVGLFFWIKGVSEQTNSIVGGIGGVFPYLIPLITTHNTNVVLDRFGRCKPTHFLVVHRVNGK